MCKLPRHQSGFVQSPSRRESAGFVAIAAFCVVIAATEVAFGFAEPWPTDLAGMQLTQGMGARAPADLHLATAG